MRNKSTHAERLAVVETQVAVNSTRLVAIEEKLDKAIEALTKSNEALMRNKGFWGGALLMISAIWAFVTQVGPHIAALFTTSPKQ